MIKIANHWCDVFVSTRLSHSHGIKFYCLPWLFIWFSILRLPQLVVGERKREREREKERTTGVIEREPPK